MKIFFFVCILFIFSSCDEHFEAKELYGYYSPAGYKNNKDTIELKADSVYHRKVYDKNNRLILEMDGKWNIERNNIIHFHPYYLNLDDDLVKFPQSAMDTSGGWQGLVETEGSILKFCVGYNIGENCYTKIGQK